MAGSKQKRRKSAGQLSTVYPLAAGIDVGATAHVVAVPPDRDARPVRTFRTFSGDLHRLAQWLKEVGITTIAMESTGVYWVPVFEILEVHGFVVLLVNARDVKNVPGRKTDVNDAQWLQQLHQHGLLRGSFVRAMVSCDCEHTCAIANGWWNTRRPTFNTCRRR